MANIGEPIRTGEIDLQIDDLKEKMRKLYRKALRTFDPFQLDDIEGRMEELREEVRRLEKRREI